MKKFRIHATAIVNVFYDIDADSKEDAREKWLQSSDPPSNESQDIIETMDHINLDAVIEQPG